MSAVVSAQQWRKKTLREEQDRKTDLVSERIYKSSLSIGKTEDEGVGNDKTFLVHICSGRSFVRSSPMNTKGCFNPERVMSEGVRANVCVAEKLANKKLIPGIVIKLISGRWMRGYKLTVLVNIVPRIELIKWKIIIFRWTKCALHCVPSSLVNSWVEQICYT